MFHVTIVAIRLGVLLCYEQHQNRSFEHGVTHEMTEKWYVAREYGNNVGVKTHRSVIMSPVK